MHVTWNFCLNLIRHLNNHNYTCLRCLRELWGAQLTTWFSLSLDYWWVFCAWFVALNCYVNLMDWSIVRVRVYFIALTLLESLYVICKMWCVKYEMWIVTSAPSWCVVNRVDVLWIESLCCESCPWVNMLWHDVLMRMWNEGSYFGKWTELGVLVGERWDWINYLDHARVAWKLAPESYLYPPLCVLLAFLICT